MTSTEPILEYEDFKISFQTEAGLLTAVDGMNLKIMPGEIMGLVGESGCGKSVTSLSAMKLLPKAARFEGRVKYKGRDILSMTSSELEQLRGNNIAMIFQEPMTALNPAFKIGDQLAEVFETHQKMNKKDALLASIEMLHKVGMPAPEKRVGEYPHQLSGGMRQRVMIAIALACKPDLLIADEPTTALDVTIQAQILELMKDLQKEYGMAILFITHDLGVVAEICDSVTVMYAGKVVEQADIKTLFNKPRHPYSKGLMNSRVTLDTTNEESLSTISGNVPSIGSWPNGCRFENRCELATKTCLEEAPPLRPKESNHLVACFNAE